MNLFAISDLHLGDGGPRDNFTPDKEAELNRFLDFVELQRDPKLVICGDLFELWQANISRVLMHRLGLLDRLARLGAIYVLGNHDIDLKYFVGQPGWLGHPFFQTMCLSYETKFAGRRYAFIHGHEADPYCRSEDPGLGRITAIYSGLKETRHGGPMRTKYRTVEQCSVGRLERLVNFLGRLVGKPNRRKAMNRELQVLAKAIGADTLVCGHTHFPGRIGDWHVNCGTWAERDNSFVWIKDEIGCQVCCWAGDAWRFDFTKLPI